MPSNFKVLSGASGEPNDPNFKNVTLLLHGDGSNGAQNNTFLDSSTNNFTITRNGNTTQGSFSPYGSNWSNYFDGTGDWISVPDNASLKMGSGDFTYECWLYPTAIPNAYQSFIEKRDAGGSGYAGVLLAIKSSGKYSILVASGSSTWGIVDESSIDVTLNAWQHIAVVRSGSTFSVYKNGVRLINTTISFSVYDDTSVQGIGAGNSSGAQPFYGYISNVRIVKGTAVYSGSSFTPPTAPLTAITNTSLLTCQSNRFRDASTNNFTITRNGDVKVTNFAPFAPSSAYSTSANGGSAYFDGSGDYLTTTYTTANFDWWTSGVDFTIEAWVFATDLSTWQYIDGASAINPVMVGNASATSTTNYWSFGPLADGTIGFKYFNGSSNLVTSTNTIRTNSWNHVAMTKTSSGITLFVNGVAQTTTAISGTPQSSTGTTLIVGQINNTCATGYISNLRIVRGTAIYSGNFTPPTSPVTAVTNTKLLLNATNGAIFDNSMKNDLETVGNAQISTSVKKFGTGSMSFDGSGDYLYPATSPNLAMGTGDFTVEGWIYATGTPSDSPIFECRSTGSATDGFTLTAFSSSVIRLFCGSALISSSGTTYVGQWVHLAVARVSGTTTFYINGTSVGSTASTINWTNQDVIVGGGRYSSGSSINVSFTGYIDDFRITKGVARYTANFTPPTAAFPNK